MLIQAYSKTSLVTNNLLYLTAPIYQYRILHIMIE